MKRFTRLIALILCFSMITGLVGCGGKKDPDPTEPPQTTVPPTTTEPAPAPEELYAQAVDALKAVQDVTLKITSASTVKLAGEEFLQSTIQTLNYQGLGTEDLRVRSVESVANGSVYSAGYAEVFADGTMYIQIDDEYLFCGEYTTDYCLQRYVPAVLLDDTLYASISAEDANGVTTLTFADAEAAEGWALPEEAEFLEASGTVTLNSEGAISKYTYSIRYQYGPTEVSTDVEAYVDVKTVEVAAPENAAEYTKLESVDAVRLLKDTIGFILQADSFSTTSVESIMCQAAGVMRNQSRTVDYQNKNSTIAKIGTNVFVMDYSSGQSESYELEEVFNKGVYTVSEDGSEPEAQSGITPVMIQTSCAALVLENLVGYDYWADAAITDLGSVYLVECQCSEELGALLESGVSETLFGDGAFLMDLASSYATTETNYYFAVDKYTGLVTATGYYFSGNHTIEGGEYMVSYQMDQSFEIPGLSVYKTVTDELEPETEPEEKATPLLYHVTGPDGQEMWLFGTIHVGDVRTGFLPQELYDAFDASDALALEFNSEAFDEKMEEDEDFEEEISSYYFYSDGTTAKDHLDPELYDIALMYMKASGSYNMNTEYMKPSIWANAIENFFLRQGCRLISDKGMEARLTARAKEQGKEILDVESGEFQIGMMTGYSDELQETLLGDAVSSNPMDYWKGTVDLYEKWCQGDEAVMRELLATDESALEEATPEELEIYNEYNNSMVIDRNAEMLKVAIGYLESGKVVFFAVGLAHLISGNGLVDTLRDAGYTVELVVYK